VAQPKKIIGATITNQADLGRFDHGAHSSPKVEGPLRSRRRVHPGMHVGPEIGP
jgi:hypothetical protein